jgi:hypothetical protein
VTRPAGFEAAFVAFSLACATETSDEDALTATLEAATPAIRAELLGELKERLEGQAAAYLGQADRSPSMSEDKHFRGVAAGLRVAVSLLGT